MSLMLGTTVLIPLPLPSILVSSTGILGDADGVRVSTVSVAGATERAERAHLYRCVVCRRGQRDGERVSFTEDYDKESLGRCDIRRTCPVVGKDGREGRGQLHSRFHPFVTGLAPSCTQEGMHSHRRLV